MSSGRHPPFHELYKKHHGVLLRRAKQICKSADLAEEVCQESWLVIFESLDGFEGRCSLRWWMLRIVTNRCLSRMQRESRFVRSGDSEKLERDVQWRTAELQTPESYAQGRQLDAVIRDAMKRLPDRQRSVLQLTQMEGRSPEEVCRTMRISPINQRVLLHRARQSVRRAIADAAYPPRKSASRTSSSGTPPVPPRRRRTPSAQDSLH